jgi:uncharacterized coiled-coil protein SlyX
MIEMDNSTNDASERLLTDWFRRVRETQRIHYACRNYFDRLHYYLGIPTIVLSGAVGTAVFASLDKQTTGNFKILVGMVSLLAAVLAGLQTFLRFTERAEKHHLTGAGYASIRRRLEMLKTFPPKDLEQLEQALTEVKNEMDALAKSSRDVPKRFGDTISEKLKSQTHDRVFTLPGKSS